MILTGTGKVVTSWPKSSVTTIEFIHVVSCRIFVAKFHTIFALHKLHITACVLCSVLASHTTQPVCCVLCLLVTQQ
jgi:hypothetical protein